MSDGKPLSRGDLWEEYSTNLHGAYDAMRTTFRQSGLSQDDIAERLSADKGLISRRLNGSENLTFKSLSFMASAMECRLTVMFTPYREVRAQSAKVKTFPAGGTVRRADDDTSKPQSKAA